MTEIKDLTGLGAMATGALTSVGNISLWHPFYTKKTRTMAQVTHAIMGGKAPLRGNLYYGYGSNLFCDISNQVMNFLGFNIFSRTVMNSKTLSETENFIGGVFAGMLSSPLLSLAERVMSLEQLGYKDPKTQILCSKSQILRSIWQEEGIRGFYKGLAPTMMRESVNSACFFGLQKVLEKRLVKVIDHKETASFISFMLSGSISGAITTAFDLIKTRMQSVVGPRLMWYGVAKKIAQEEGVKVLLTHGMGWRVATIAVSMGTMGPLSAAIRNNLPEHPLLKQQ